jgi:hypothetical protein
MNRGTPATACGVALRRETASGNVRLLFPVSCLLWLLTLPLVGHGCHGDDVDHEPGAAPPVRSVVVLDAEAKTSR